MIFNLTAYSHMLLEDFAANGGKIEIKEFHAPGDFAASRQKTPSNATGYGARALFDNGTIPPVRGQLTRLIRQPEVNHGLFYGRFAFVPRRAGGQHHRQTIRRRPDRYVPVPGAASALRISRQLTMPIGRRSSSTTGMQETDRSSINAAASATVACDCSVTGAWAMIW